MKLFAIPAKVVLPTAIALIALATETAQAQQKATPTFTRQDTLRGTITPERAWWDLTYYHLDIKVNPADSTPTRLEHYSLQSAGTLPDHADRPAGTHEADPG